MEKVTARRALKGRRLEYSMVGEVASINEQSVLVKRQNSNAYFWIDKNEQHCPLNKGDMGCFIFNISTFPSNRGEPNGLIITKLKLSAPAAKCKPALEGDEFLGGVLRVDIEEVIPTNMEGLFLMRLTATHNNETIWARYYDPTGNPTHAKDKTVYLRLMKTKLTITNKGEVFADEETREEDIGVGKVQAKYPRWFTWLEVSKIKW